MLLILAVAASTVVVWWMLAIATAAVFAGTRRQYNGRSTTPLDLALVCIGWPIALVWVIGARVAISDDKREKRALAKQPDPEFEALKSEAHTELRSLRSGERLPGGVEHND